MSALHLVKRPDGVAVVRFDTPDSPVNVLSRGLLDELTTALDDIASDPEVRACVLSSAKPGTFIAGANIDEVMAVENAREAEELSRGAQRGLDRIARNRKPFVAAIHGPALGGGLEVALACHYRLAVDDASTVLALPEVQLGLLPAAGGTQRLPRLIGLELALPLMLTGRRVRARRALRLGLVDALTAPGSLEDTAARAATLLAAGELPRTQRRRSPKDRLLETGPGRRIALRKARAEALHKSRGLYPAPAFLLECVETGYEAGIEAGLDRESVLFGRLVASFEAKCMMRLFKATTALKKTPEGDEPRPVERLAVLGGGFMGAGIAEISLPHAEVVVKDVSEDSLSRCARTVYEGMGRRVRSEALTPFQRDRQLSRLRLVTDDSELGNPDLVIEAVFEELELKRKVLAETEAHIAPTAVFASNTSALPIALIAANAAHPERVLGMHYFSPVPRMPLLELVVTPSTADWAVATARRFGIRQGKSVIVVKDSPGFYTSRILAPYLTEATVLLEEGARVEDVDAALLDFGFPVGPLALLDEVGLDVVAHVTKNMGALYAHRGLAPSKVLPSLHEAGFAGRKNKRGFYRYDRQRGKGEKQVDESVYSFFGVAARRYVAPDSMAARLALLMVNEAVYCLQEEVVASPLEGDVGAVLGLGFPPFRGGPFRFLDGRGLDTVVNDMQRLRDAHGPRFEPAPLLQDMAREGRRFHAA